MKQVTNVKLHRSCYQFRAYDFVLSKVESSNLSLEENISVPGIHGLEMNLSKTMSIGDVLNLSYSLALKASSSLGEANCSQISFTTKKALNLLKIVLKEVHKCEISSNLTSTPVGSIRRLQIAFERHKRLLYKLNLSIQKIKYLNETNLNLSLFKQLYQNASMILENASIIAFYNASEAARMLAEANRIRAEMRKEIVKCCQIAKAEKMLNRTLSRMNLSAIPEDVASEITNLTKEFNEAKAKGDVRKIKEILREMKKAVAHEKHWDKIRGKEKQIEGSEGLPEDEEGWKGKGKKRGKGWEKGKKKRKEKGNG